MGGESSDTRSCAKDGLSRYSSQAELLRSELSSCLREVRFNKQEFSAGTPIPNIQYNYPKFQNNNLFYPFHDQLDYEHAKYLQNSRLLKAT